ncbi:hypothetical protein F0U44_14890 [Nocardioides humilatus]|uniref:Septum formation initiator family protein n=1 Tax=Nocardioides humilatus TaxID=2607660 RepID=A0A5B1LB07_9ACTN|nr:hypothetical protein [Nocardioides humilatus]KAA1417923.1 hypothetical protein F0U44_14890 [Nocardioides humilatus]
MSSSSAPQLRSRLPRLAEVAVQRARLTVVPRPRNRPRAPRVPFVIFVSVIMLGGVVGLLLFNTSMQQASFRETALEQQVADLTAREEALNLELQEKRSFQHVAYEAQKAGMVFTTGAACVLGLGTGEIKGTCVPALPDNRIPINPPGVEKPAALDPAPVIVRDKPDPKTDPGTKGGNPSGDGAPNNNQQR